MPPSNLTVAAGALRVRAGALLHSVSSGSASERAFHRNPLVYGGMAAYAVLSVGLMAVHRVGLTSEHIILLALVLFALTVRARPFVWDWLPFLFVAVMFEDLSAVAGTIAGSVHAAGPILLERTLLGGAVASTWLQDHLRRLPLISVAGGLLVAEYLFHFAAAPLCALWLWLRHRHHFNRFVAAYVLVMSAGFLIYLLYPEKPPWLAAREGLLVHVDRIVVQGLQQVAGPLGQLYSGADPEPNAAMPSLHVSIPVIVCCAIFAVRGRRSRLAWLSILYPLTISFGVVYLGEHYVLDSVIGIALALGCWWAAVRWTSMPQRPALAAALPAAQAPPGRPRCCSPATAQPEAEELQPVA